MSEPASISRIGQLLEKLHVKVRKIIDDLEALKFEPPPDVVPLQCILEGRGGTIPTSYRDYDCVI